MVIYLVHLNRPLYVKSSLLNSPLQTTSSLLTVVRSTTLLLPFLFYDGLERIVCVCVWRLSRRHSFVLFLLHLLCFDSISSFLIPLVSVLLHFAPLFAPTCLRDFQLATTDGIVPEKKLTPSSCPNKKELLDRLDLAASKASPNRRWLFFSLFHVERNRRRAKKFGHHSSSFFDFSSYSFSLFPSILTWK